MKNKFDLEKEFFNSLKYIKESKKYIYGILGVFVLFMFIGIFIPLPEEFSLQILSYFEALIEKILNYSSGEMIWFLFQNNVIASFLGLFLGLFFGVFSFVNSVMNGFVLGFAIRVSVEKAGLLSLWRIFPHGIFELPALIISLGLGTRLGIYFFKSRKLKNLKEMLIKSIKAFLLVIVPLLVIAAIIEGLLIVLKI
jgi:stage II sporulation protein M